MVTPTERKKPVQHNIGIDARYGLRANRRGIGNYIYSLLKEFSSIYPPDIRFFLYADQTAGGEMMPFFQAEPFTVRVLSAPNLALWEQWALPRAARRDRLDILHCTANIAPVLWKPCRLVTTIHDVIEFRRREFGDLHIPFRHRVSRVYRMGVLPSVARISDVVLTVSEYSRQDIAQALRVSPEKIVVTYEAPVNTGEDAAGAEFLPSGIQKNNYIFALGAVDKRKNTARLIAAYQKLRAGTGGGVPSLVVAGIENPAVFASLAGEGILLYDFLPDQTIAALYRHALFFVYPSLYEGFGLPVLEAMLRGTPVICPATTSTGEIAADAALTFNPVDADELAAKMKLLVAGDGLRAELSRKGRLRAAEFSWRRCARETLAAYEKLLTPEKAGGE